MIDPKTAWQNQPTQPSIMTPERMREKVQELHAKTRRELIKSIAGPLIVVAICGFAIQFPDPVLRVLFVLAIAWSLTGQYFLNRGMWSATLPGDVALSTGIESYRREVERRRSISGRFLLWSLGPVVFAIATFVVPLLQLGIRKGMLLSMIPFLALLVIWIVGVFILRVRHQRELRRVIDELKEIERVNKC